MQKLFFLVLIFSTFSHAQTKIASQLLDSNNEPVIQAIVKCYEQNSTENKLIDIVFSSIDGIFELNLETSKKYLIEIKSLYYKDIYLTISESNLPNIIKLENEESKLETITITHDKPKLVIKKDTVTFNLSNIIDPNDRKLKDLIEKIPGLILDENGSMYFRGQLITRLLVEGETFFGGGTKIGIDNIPADALEKLEIISNYSKSNILKDSRRSNEQVINLVLKNKKKAITFGDSEATSDFDTFYKLYSSFFNFKIKNQTNLILNTNNIGLTSLGYNDFRALNNVDSNLFQFSLNNYNSLDSDQEFKKIDDQSYLAQLQRNAENSNWDLLISYNHHKTLLDENADLRFLNNSAFDITQTEQLISKKNFAFRGLNFYQSDIKERIFALLFSSDQANIFNDVLSNSTIGLRNFNASSSQNNFTINSILEQTNVLNSKSKLNYGIQLKYERNKHESLQSSDDIFLESLINWNNVSTFELLNKSIENNFELNTGFNWYYNVNKNHNLIFESFNSYQKSNGSINQFQIDNNRINLGEDFSGDFNNYRFVLRNGIAYNLNEKKVDVVVGFSLLNYNNRFTRFDKNKIEVNTILPKLTLNYDINLKNEIELGYFQELGLPNVNQLNPTILINNYNNVSIGNSFLELGKSHNFRFRFSNLNLLKGYSFASNNNFKLIDKQINSAIESQEINQIRSLILQNSIGNNFNTTNNLTFIKGKYEFGSGIKFRFNRMNILLDDINQISKTYNFSFSPFFKTTFKKTPNIVSSFTIGKNILDYNNSIESFNFSALNVDVNHNFFKKIYVSYSINYVTLNNNKALNKQSFEIRYTNNLKNLDVSLIGINVTEGGILKRVVQNDFMQTEINNSIIPKRILLSVKYNF